MDQATRERLLNRVLSGLLIFEGPDGNLHAIRPPTRLERHLADRVYEAELKRASFEGLYTDAELIKFLMDNEIWDEESEELLDKLPKEIEEFKVRLFQLGYKKGDQVMVRKALEIAKAKLAELTTRRHSHDHLSCGGAASIARGKDLVARCIVRVDGAQIHPTHFPCLIEAAITAQTQNFVDESAMRELARTDPWRGIWAVRGCGTPIFDGDVRGLSDDQIRLLSYSSLYDSVHGHPECPADDVINDDDLLDGWLIVQRRKRGEAQKGKAADLIANEKVRNSQEIFLPVGEDAFLRPPESFGEEAKAIDDINDDFARATKARRMNHLKKHGVVEELDMPDTRQKVRMEMTRRLAERGNG